MTCIFSVKFHSPYTYWYSARVRYNKACLLVYSLRFSIKYRLVLCNIRPRAIAVIRRCIVSNTDVIQKKLLGVKTGPEAGEGAGPLLETHEVKTPSARAQLALIM